MAKIGVFGELLLLVGHVDQKIESVTFGIAFDDRHELLFVQLQKLVNCRPERVQQAVVLFTAGTADPWCGFSP